MIVVTPGWPVSASNRHHGGVSSTLDPGTNPETRPDGTLEKAGPEPSGLEGHAGAAARRRRGEQKTVRDLVLSMLAVVGVVVVIVLAVPRPSSVPHRAVDVESAAKGAAAALGFVPAVPRGLPAGWTATSADVRNSGDGIKTWHIGYMTADGAYASVEQAATVSRRWEEILTSGGVPREAQVIDGTTWEQRYKDVRDVYALIHRGERRTTMVTSKNGGLDNAVVLARSIPVTLR
jgi:hypothetical protein